jgi:hypothetical protein
MRNKLSQSRINHTRDLWKAIEWQMNVHRIDPEQLADKTPYSKDLIERGIRGEHVPMTSDFKRACVRAFGSVNARATSFGRPIGNMSDEGLDEILKPESAMPPRQGNFWEQGD